MFDPMLAILVSAGFLQEAPPAKTTPPDPAGAAAQPDRPAVQDLRAADDANKRYFLISKADLKNGPSGGFKLLLVLPGGDGSADFQPFVTNIWKQALSEDYVIAQLVAPQWSPKQAEDVVWPTHAATFPEVKFTTEQFIDAVIDDVQSRIKINADFIFTLSWSSGGPAAYAAALNVESRITGSLVAMSVFKPEQLKTLANAKDKAFYILHSPQDFIPMRFPEAARDQLASHGAVTKLVTYEGGHGWHGDVFGNIRNGIKWLEEQRAKLEKSEDPADAASPSP